MSLSYDERLSIAFDPDTYILINPDVRSFDEGAWSHYIKYGWIEGRRPNFWFNDDLVPLESRGDAPGVPPFVKFLIDLPGFTEDEFIEICRSSGGLNLGHLDCWDCDKMRTYFDAKYYISLHQDVRSNNNPLLHFCETGWRERKRPNTWFNTGYYIDNNHDVFNAEINPFVHYLTAGAFEGRRPEREDPQKYFILSSLPALVRRPSVRHNISFIPCTPIALAGLILESEKGVALSISHDEYISHTGGIQRFIADEQRSFTESGYAYLSLSPVITGRGVACGDPAAFILRCVLNGRIIGDLTGSEVAEALSIYSSKVQRSEFLSPFILHSTLGWCINSIIKIFGSHKFSAYWYFHDYSLVCVEYRLVRNGVEHCSPSPATDGQCNYCLLRKHRANHTKIMRKLYEALGPTGISPSETARDVVISTYPELLDSIILHPHIMVSVRNDKKSYIATSSDMPITVAYCGHPDPYKGYEFFMAVVDSCFDVRNIKFIHIGTPGRKHPNVSYHSAKLVNGESVMADTIRRLSVDIVFLPSVWKETFNYIAYEAIAGGACVITTPGSGNIAAMVQKYDVGCIVVNPSEVKALFEDTHFIDKLMKWKKNISKLEMSFNRSVFDIPDSPYKV